MPDVGKYAVIPTNAVRPGVLQMSVGAVLSQPVDALFLVCTWPSEWLVPAGWDRVHEIYQAPRPRNLSRWWNVGLDAARDHAVRQGLTAWDVAVVNDDAILPRGWFGICSEAMRMRNAAACGSVGEHIPVATHVRPGPINLHYQMPGWAFMLRGEVGLRADERLLWWYGDNDLDWQARQHGGTVVVPGLPVDHLHPNGQLTDELPAQIQTDRQTFVDKWGVAPW